MQQQIKIKKEKIRVHGKNDRAAGVSVIGWVEYVLGTNSVDLGNTRNTGVRVVYGRK